MNSHGCSHPTGKGNVTAAPREFEGTLYAGHESFKWLLAVIAHVLSVQVSLNITFKSKQG
jgi:hypothetical protein